MQRVIIGICDNEFIQIELLKRRVEAYMIERKVDYEIISSTNSEAFLRNAKEYKIAFLDVDMDGKDIDGIEIGRRLREVNKTAYVIYVTGYQEYMAYAQGVHFFYYLLKSSDKSRLVKLLDEIFEYSAAREIKISLPVKNGKEDFKIHEINYFEIHKNITASTTKKNKYEVLLGDIEINQIIENMIFTGRINLF